ncbi:secreted protein [Melampsora americana]|nr:secreted protein [Melampsora americana]
MLNLVEILMIIGCLACLDTIKASIEVCGIADNGVARDACGMQKAFAGSLVFPQVMPDFKPLGALYAQYGHIVVGGAQQLAPAEVNRSPILSLALLDQKLSSTQFVAFCIDFQPSNLYAKLIWLQDGLSLNSNTHLLTSSKRALIPYQSPNPIKGTGTHEYVILVYQQTNVNQFHNWNSSPFNLKNFIARFGLNGHLIAGSFFKSHYDARMNSKLVPTLTKLNNPPINHPSRVHPRSIANVGLMINLCNLNGDVAHDGCQMQKAFAGSSVAPHIIPSFHPLGALYVQYKNIIVGGAQQLSPSETSIHPSLTLKIGIKNYNLIGKRYVVLLVDSSKGTSIVNLNWALWGISIDSNSHQFKLSSEKILCDYLPPHSKPSEREFVFLVYELSSDHSSISKEYRNLFRSVSKFNHDQVFFDLGKFVNLHHLNDPIAGSCE